MKIQEIEDILTSSGIEKREAVIEVKMMIEHYCNYSAMDLIMGKRLDYEKLKIVYEKAKLRAETKQPIQYIIGHANFMHHNYKVTKDVLIPRDETELLIDDAIDLIREKGYKNVLDIGTGSGCISCEIAYNTDCRVLGVDISSDALRIALENSASLGLENKAVFRKSDIYSNIREDEKFDLIISNPPYIPKGTQLQKEVTFEPELALFTEDKDGVEFYQKIIKDAKKYLNKEGTIMFEIGINQSPLVKDMLEQAEFKHIVIEKDLAGIDRVITALNV